MTETLLQRISLDPEICHGKPCIRGLQGIAIVAAMRGKATAKMTTDAILSLTRCNE